MQAFHQPLTIQEGHNDVTVHRTDAAIDHQDVAIEDLRPFHRVTADREEEGRDRVSDQVVVDVETTVSVVLGG